MGVLMQNDSLVGGIDSSLVNKIGTATLDTIAQDLSGAVNELKATGGGGNVDDVYVNGVSVLDSNKIAQIDLTGKVNTTGDTMTGNLIIKNATAGAVQITNPNTDLREADNNVSSAQFNQFRIVDDGSHMTMGYFGTTVYPEGLVQGTLQVSNFDTNGDPVSNGISLTVDKDGSKSYSVSDGAAFRRAIGVVNRAAANAGADLSLVTTGDKYTWNNKVDKSGDTMTGALSMAGTDINLKTSGSSSDDSGDIVWYYGNGQEKARLWTNDAYTAESGLNFRMYKEDGTSLFSGTIPLRNTTYNFSGTTFYSGKSDVAEHDCNNAIHNGNYYYTSNGPATSIGASTSDGALYVQSYSDNWVAQIAQDYRNGRLFVRGKNNGTWQSWRQVADSGNVGAGDSNGQVKIAGTNVSVKGLGSAAYLTASTSATANTVAQRQGNGYLYAVYYNTSCGAEDPNSLTSYAAFIDSNGWLRKSSRLNFVKYLTHENVTSPALFVTMTSSWGKFGWSTPAQTRSGLGLGGCAIQSISYHTVACNIPSGSQYKDYSITYSKRTVDAVIPCILTTTTSQVNVCIPVITNITSTSTTIRVWKQVGATTNNPEPSLKVLIVYH